MVNQDHPVLRDLKVTMVNLVSRECWDRRDQRDFQVPLGLQGMPVNKEDLVLPDVPVP